MVGRLGTACIVAATLIAPGVPASGQAAGEPAVRDVAASAQLAYLQHRLELAKGEAFYLLLDPATASLALMYGGALLQTYPVHDVRIGHPRAAFAAVDDSPEWHSTIWSHGALTPARPEVEQLIKPKGGDADDEDTVVIPPTAEEAIPAPSRFRVRFEGGLALEIRRVADPESTWWTAFSTGWAHRWQDVWSAVVPWDRDALRVRVVLDASDADRLYRALPPDTKLLIAGPTSGAP